MPESCCAISEKTVFTLDLGGSSFEPQSMTVEIDIRNSLNWLVRSLVIAAVIPLSGMLISATAGLPWNLKTGFQNFRCVHEGGFGGSKTTESMQRERRQNS